MKQSPSPARHSSAPTRFVRRMVLGTAFLLGLAIAFAPRSPAVHAQEPKQATATAPKSATKSVTISDGKGAEVRIEVEKESPPATAADPASEGRADAATSPDGATKDAPDRRGAKPRKHARVTIDGIGTDREFDSISELAHDQPAIAAMVVLIVAVVFFAPVLAIALILWYRMRKARMLNETMLALAEKGIVPPAEALDALVRRQAAGGVGATPSAGTGDPAPRRVVGPAQGRDGRWRGARAFVVFAPRGSRGERARARAAIRRYRICRPLVVRGTAPRSPRSRDAGCTARLGQHSRESTPGLMAAWRTLAGRLSAPIIANGGASSFRCRTHRPGRRSG